MILKQQNKNPVSFIVYKLKPSHSLKASHKKEKKKPTFATMDSQQSNPIYNHLNQQRNNRHIVQFIMGFDAQHKQRPASLSRGRSYSPNFSAFSRKHSNTSRQVERFRTRGEDIFLNADRMTAELKKNKKKINILNQYNELVDRYCDLAPKLKSKDDKQIFIAHMQIERLCTEQALMKEEDIGKRAMLFKHYQEPKVNFKSFKRAIRIVTTPKPQITQLSQDIHKRNNTFSF